MSQQGAVLQNYNNKLAKCIEELCSKRDDLNKQILREEMEKAAYLKNLKSSQMLLNVLKREAGTLGKSTDLRCANVGHSPHMD
uniref:Uncharacterized protein n=1 Tax=Erpetoichthys calabaricus TaxID=27687 RepID=A0A8C4T3P2_ERPCA